MEENNGGFFDIKCTTTRNKHGVSFVKQLARKPISAMKPGSYLSYNPNYKAILPPIKCLMLRNS